MNSDTTRPPTEPLGSRQFLEREDRRIYCGDPYPTARNASTDLGPAFRWAVGLNIGYVLVEGAVGFLTGALALLADAAHNLTDVAGLLIAWGAAALAKRVATRGNSWGIGRATIMAAMLNALAILIGVAWVVWEAVLRFQTPVDLPGTTILIVALVGIGLNTGSALLPMRSQKHDLNARAPSCTWPPMRLFRARLCL